MSAHIEILSRKDCFPKAEGLHAYAAWPTVARLQNGRLALVASAFRLEHICPFGKCVIAYSEDEGEHWSFPAPLIDTLLDDRDGGITAFGKEDVIVTSFNNSIPMQRKWAAEKSPAFKETYGAYVESYLKAAEIQDWKKYLGVTARFSHDSGASFGRIVQLPVTCPHGPAALPDGSLLLCGNPFWDPFTGTGKEGNGIEAWRIDRDGNAAFLGTIPSAGEGLVMYEPHAILLPGGSILVHIRVEDTEGKLFTIFQSESCDGGRSFTKPHQILRDKGGAPAHIISDGDVLISVYGYREEPYGIRVMFSKDEGKTWDSDFVLADDGASGDIGYPASVLLKDGSILTVYYSKTEKDGPANIRQIRWRYQG